MSQSNLPNKILVVDEDITTAQALEEPLQRQGVKVDKATNLDTALYLYNQARYEVVLIELNFSTLPGLAMVQKWRAHEKIDRRCCGFIMMHGNKMLDSANDGLIKELGDLETINKPITSIKLLPYLSRALATYRRLVALAEVKDKVLNYYEKSGDFEKAAQHVQKHLSEVGPRGLDMLFDIYEKAERYEDALKVLDPLIEKTPNSISLMNSKARLLLKTGNVEEARKILEKCDALAPQNIDRLNEMATMYLHLKKPEMSVDKFKEILQLSPENPDVKFEMFSKLFDHGFDEHAAAFGKDCTKPMEIVRHYNNKGVLLSRDGMSDKALEEYQRALKFYPTFKENYRIYYNKALALSQKGSLESLAEAVELLKTCLQLQPNFEKARNTLQTLERIIAKRQAS